MNISEFPLVLLIAGAIMVGLYLSNLMYDYKVPQYISRKIGHGVGGMGLLLLVYFFQEPWWPLVLTGGFTLLLGGARLIRPNTFRGVGGTGRSHALAEVWFPLASTISILVGWVWLNNPKLAIVPCLYMAWGDMVTGLIRSKVYGREVKGNWGSLGMLITCLLVGALFTPYWVAVVGAVVATLAEKYSGLSRTWVDDNWTIIVSSLLMMSLLLEVVKNG